MNNVKKAKLSFSFIVIIVTTSMGCSTQSISESFNDSFAPYKCGNFRSYSEAESFALNAINIIDETLPTRHGSRRTIDSGMCYSKPATKSEHAADSLFYVFNFSDSAGFAIIAANRQASPIVAITEKGTYNPGVKTGVEGFDEYMEQIISTFSGFEKNGATPHSYYEEEIIGFQMAPLISVRWGQTGVYGQYCSNGISGCVITATAQIMSYLENPDTIVLSVDMDDDYSAGDTLVLNWPLIKEHIANHADSSSCDTVHKQIGAFMRELGALYNANYQTNSTSASTANSVNIYSSFGVLCSNFTTANINAIKQSLSKSRPVHMRGNTINNEGHSFIVDGYKDFEVWRTTYIAEGQNGEFIVSGTTKVSESHSLHINWGWDGVCNGYFSFDSYATASGEEYDTENNSVNYDFCNNVYMVANIRNSGLTP